MKFKQGDKVAWRDNHDDRGEVIEVQSPDRNRSRGSSEWRVRVRFRSGAIGWISGEALRSLDVVTRLGDLVRD